MSDADNAGFLSRWSRRKAQTQTQTEAQKNGAVSADAAPTQLPLPLPAAPPAPMPVSAAADAKPAAAQQQTAVKQPAQPAAAPLPPTLDDVALLTRDSSYARFVAPDVAGTVRNAALKKLFTDPHFNVMDGLDIYIDDYGKPDPLPASWLRQMVQSKALGLFDDDADDEPAGAVGAARPADAPVVATIETPVVAPDAEANADTHSALDPPSSTHPTTNTDTSDDENADLRLQPDDAAGCKGAEPCADGDAGRQR